MYLSLIVVSLFLSVLVVFKTPITVYMKWYKKKDEKQTNKKQNKKNKLCDFYFFFRILFCLGSSQLFRLKYIGERIKIIYEYIIKNLKYRKMHTHVDSYA